MTDLSSIAAGLRDTLGAPLAIAAGALLLLFGRRLYWFFAAAVGFVATVLLVGRALPELDAEVALIVSLIGGLVGSLVVVFAHKFLLSLVGAVGGGLIALWQAQALGLERGIAWVLAALLGAVVGAWLISALFEFAVVLLTSLFGAQLLIDGMRIDPTWTLPAFLALVGVGLVFQLARSKRRRRRRSKED